MTIEEKLKDFILLHYHSVREFTLDNDIPYTTMHSIFKRGINNSSIANVFKICKALGISADALADGEIVSIKTRSVNLTPNTTDAKEILENAKYIFIHSETITLEGQPLGQSGIESIIDTIEVGLEIAKKKNQL